MHEFLHLLYQMIRHLSPETLEAMITYVGPTLIYVVLFAIVFAETGLVVTPFLPGDSLLFAVGVVAATTKAVSLPTVLITLCLAANCGDLLNYFFGYRIGPKVFSRESDVPVELPLNPGPDLEYERSRQKPSLLARLLNKKHLMEAQRFYEKHGRKTIILARFVPIVRTFAPFVAGIGRMNFLNFAAFSVTGGVLWVSLCLFSGYWLANVQFIRKHFDLVVVAIVVISVLPMIVHAIQAKRRGGEAQDKAGAAPVATEQQVA